MGTYTLQDFNTIIFNGFNFTLSDDIIQKINELATQVGSPTYIKTPVFQKKDRSAESAASPASNTKRRRDGNNNNNRFNNNGAGGDGEKLFNATKLVHKTGLDGDIDLIRSYLNKITDRTFVDMKTNIIGLLDKLIEENSISPDDVMRISSYLFEFASTNRYFSKLYADLYTELVNKYECMKQTLDDSFHSFLELFINIEYVDPDVNYDEFCRINKVNEKRKALSAFFINLSANNLLSHDKLVDLTHNMILRVVEYMPMSDKKAHVDEYTENIAILFNKGEYAKVTDKLIDGKTIMETIKMLATSKPKTYPGLSSKCIFKYMDLIDM
jgi:hypothetical protein